MVLCMAQPYIRIRMARRRKVKQRETRSAKGLLTRVTYVVRKEREGGGSLRNREAD